MSDQMSDQDLAVKETHAPMTEGEQQEWCALTDMVARDQKANSKGWFPRPVLQAWLRTFYGVATELAVVYKHESEGVPQVLLCWRDDDEFKGWHMPGGIKLPGILISKTAASVVARELHCSDVSSETARLAFVHEVSHGDGPEEDAHREMVCLVHVAYVDDRSVVDGLVRIGSRLFFSLDSIPEDTLGMHKAMLRKLAKYLRGEAVV
jgi:hypothetical protein